MKTPAPILRLIVLFFLSVMGSVSAQYIFTTIDNPLGVKGTQLTSISGSNMVGAYTDSGGILHGFIYNGSIFTTIDDSAGTQGTATYGISGSNIVGTYNNGTTHGFLYDGSTFTALNDPSATGGTQVFGISGSTIVGSYTTGTIITANHGFLYNGTTYTTLNDPSGSNTFATSISGTNIVGSYTANFTSVIHGFLYNGSSYTTLDAPLAHQVADQGTLVFGISGTNIVGGYYDSNGILHGYLYNGSTWTTIDNPLGVQGTTLYSMNGTTMVGVYKDASGITHGFKATPDLYYQWLQQNGYPPGGPNTGFGQDANHNGIPNGVEYMVPSGLSVVPGASSATITALVRQDPQVTTTLWSSIDFVTWTQLSFPAAADQSGVPTGFVRMQVVDDSLVSKKFYRVKATR